MASGFQVSNGEQTFVDLNGDPLVGGFVFHYIPGTTTQAPTWQDQGLTVPNTNPIALDGAGRATIWGNTTYRQVVTDRLGNLQWDQLVGLNVASGTAWTEAKATNVTGNQTFTSPNPNTVQLDSSPQGALTFSSFTFGPREVEAQFTCGLQNSAGGAAEAQFTLQASYDFGVTWTTLNTFQVGGYCSTTSTFKATVQSAVTDNGNAQQSSVLYRLQAALTLGTSLTVFCSSSTQFFALRARQQ